MGRPSRSSPRLRAWWIRSARFRHGLWHPYPPLWASRFSLFTSLVVPTLVAIFLLSSEITTRRRYVTLAFPASATPLAALGATDPWEVDVGYEVEATWKPLGWTVSVRERWVAVVDPSVSGPARRPEEIFRGAPPVTNYLRPHLSQKRAELNPSWFWRLGVTPIDTETLEAIAFDMVANGDTERRFFVLWQVPVAILGSCVLAAAVYFTIAALARERKRAAVERSASANVTGKCPECEYPTDGLDTGVCPECGWDHARLNRRLSALRGRYQRRRWADHDRPVRSGFP